MHLIDLFEASQIVRFVAVPLPRFALVGERSSTHAHSSHRSPSGEREASAVSAKYKTGDEGAMTVQEIIVEKLSTLPLEKQQEVLDFVEFLQAQMQKRELRVPKWQPGVSALTAAQEFVGCVEGPEDLSTNKKYMEGFGS